MSDETPDEAWEDLRNYIGNVLWLCGGGDQPDGVDRIIHAIQGAGFELVYTLDAKEAAARSRANPAAGRVGEPVDTRPEVD